MHTIAYLSRDLKSLAIYENLNIDQTYLRLTSILLTVHQNVIDVNNGVHEICVRLAARLKSKDQKEIDSMM